MLTVGIFAAAQLSLLSPAVCQKKPVPRWESLSQRTAQKIQHCFEASRWAEFQLRLSQDTDYATKYSFAPFTRKQWHKIGCDVQCLQFLQFFFSCWQFQIFLFSSSVGWSFIHADIWREKPFSSRPFPRVCLLTGEDSGEVPWVPKQAQWSLFKGVRSDGFGSGLYHRAFPKWFHWNGFAQITHWEKATGVGHFICTTGSVHFTVQLYLTLTWPTAEVTSCLIRIRWVSKPTKAPVGEKN